MIEAIDALIQAALTDDGADYRQDIVRFVSDVLGAEPAAYQSDILRMLVDHRRVAVRSLHGIGKTALAAWVVLWGIAAFDDDVKVVTTASVWRQLVHFLWPEIRKWAIKADWSRVNLQMRRGKELLEQSIKLDGKEAFAAASSDPATMEGAHAATLIYVFDEAKVIRDEVWDSVEGAFATGNCYWLAISTPGDPSGRFYAIHSRRPGMEDWKTRHVTLEEAIAAGRVSPQWVEQRKAQWGESSAIYQNRVLGEFAASAEDNVIPLAWVEAANRRWEDCNGRGEGKISYGVDVARYGEDKTAIARLVGRVCEQIDYYTKQSTMETTGRVAALIENQTPTGVDVVGLGAGVFDRLKEQGYEKVQAVNAGAATTRTDKTGQLMFENIRSLLWWMLRERLDPDSDDPLNLPPDDLLISDLTAPRFTYTSRGRIRIESKDDIRKRIGRSPDGADALALAVYVVHHGIAYWEPEIA